jgi:RNA polymerase sigma factor (sigma-70 family)
VTAALAVLDSDIDQPTAACRRRAATNTDPARPLSRGAQAGDREAFGRLYERHLERVRRFLAARLHGHADDVDDLVADTFLTAMQRIDAFQLDQPGEFGNWLVGIARNKLLNWLNRPARRDVAIDEPGAGVDARCVAGGGVESVSPEHVALDRVEVADALSRLSPRVRRAFVLQHAVDLPTAEIALALGTTKRVVWGLTGKAREQLRGQVAAGVAVAAESSRRHAAATAPAMPVALCACGCGLELPAVRDRRQRYASAACRYRAASRRRKEAQRRLLAGPATADPVVGRVLALVQAAGGEGIDRGELSRRTRVLVARLDRALDLLARRHLISVGLEPGDGRLVVRYRALASAAATAWRAA